MSGATPKAHNHAALPPLASRFVEVAGLPWEKTRFAGVEAKTLLVDRDTGVVTSLMKFAPGANFISAVTMPVSRSATRVLPSTPAKRVFSQGSPATSTKRLAIDGNAA